eukprot:scpid100753/ scgid26446/ 
MIALLQCPLCTVHSLDGYCGQCVYGCEPLKTPQQTGPVQLPGTAAAKYFPPLQAFQGPPCSTNTYFQVQGTSSVQSCEQIRLCCAGMAQHRMAGEMSRIFSALHALLKYHQTYRKHVGADVCICTCMCSRASQYLLTITV